MVKLLIAEDEAGIRNSLVRSFTWEALGCELIGAAASGLEALELYLKYSPDIVLTDIVMPGIDGIALLKYIREKNKACRIIIITGHRDFEYAKEALNLGADCFLMKPVKAQDLEEILQKHVMQLNAESSRLQEEMLAEAALRDRLYGRPVQAEAGGPDAEVLRGLRDGCYVAVAEFDDAGRDSPKRQQNLYAFCRGLAGPDFAAIMRMEDSHLSFLIHGGPNAQDEVMEGLRKLSNAVGESFQYTVSFGVSDWQPDTSNLHGAYLNSLRAVAQRFFLGSGSVSGFCAEKDGGASPDFVGLLKQTNNLETLIRQTDGVQMNRRALRLYDDLMRHLDNNIHLVKSTVLVFLTLGIRQVLGNDIRHMAVLFGKYANFQSITASSSEQVLRDIFQNVVMDLSDYVSVKKTGNKQQLIERVTAYIGENFCQSISLGDLARSVYLSPSYLSTFITRETGKTFVELLNEARMNRATELLRNKDKKISTIAHEVGFNEPQYFSIAFKKYTGITPTEYRSQYGI